MLVALFTFPWTEPEKGLGTLQSWTSPQNVTALSPACSREGGKALKQRDERDVVIGAIGNRETNRFMFIFKIFTNTMQHHRRTRKLQTVPRK